MMTSKTSFGAVLALSLIVSAAQAQTAGDAGKTTAPSTIQGNHGDSLSSKLHESGGVIQPKGNVDPGMATPTPDPKQNTMPVIPPKAIGGDTAK